VTISGDKVVAGFVIEGEDFNNHWRNKKCLQKRNSIANVPGMSACQSEVGIVSPGTTLILAPLTRVIRQSVRDKSKLEHKYVEPKIL